MKRILSIVLVAIVLLSVIPMGGITSVSASALMTASQLQAKFPHGKYWNHAGNPGSSNSVNNQNGYTSTPCSKHGGYIGTSQQTCNGFQPGSAQLSWQCMGYAEKLGYDFTGYNPRNNANGWCTYTSSSALNSLKPGDIVRYKNNGHSIFVTAVNGETVTYTDCNSDGHCVIKWGKTISKSTLRSSFTHVRSAPFALPDGPVCSCSSSYAGTYVCTTSSINLTIRSGHGTSYSAVGSIPPKATVYVSKASGTSNSDWAHVEYNGVSGYASMEYLKKQATHAETPTISWWISDTEYGNSVDTCKAGNSYYFCVKLTDSVSGKLWNEVSKNNYTLKLTFYNPDGSEKFSSNVVSNDDNYWIKSFFGEAGIYKYSVVLDGDFLFSGSRNFTVQDNPKEIHTSATSASLNLSGTKSQTINVWSSGYYDGSTVFNWKKSNDNVTCSWGEWNSDNKLPLTITAVSPGTTKVTLSIKDKDTDKVLDSVVINVTVSENTKPTGSITTTNNTASSQTVTLNLSDSYGVAGYYWGTSSSYTNNSYYSVSGSPKNTSVTKTVSSAGTYYLAVKDISGNISTVTSVTFSKITLNANGGSVTPANIIAKSGNSVKLPTPTRSGYTFKGWSAFSSDTSGVTTITAPSANNTYYATWQADSTALNVNSTNNAGVTKGGEIKNYTFTPSVTGKYVIYSTAAADTKVYLYNAEGTLIASNDDGGEGRNFRLEYNLIAGTKYKYSISYWDSSKTGTIPFKFGNVHTISYNANGGSGAPSNQYKDYGTALVISTASPTRNGYEFKGWATSSTSTTVAYRPGETYNTESGITLYAVWGYVDSTKPVVSVTTETKLVSSQTVTLNMSDNTGVVSYYWGTNATPASASFTVITAATSKIVVKSVSDSGTYYLIAKDAAGNTSATTVTFNKLTLKGNGGSVTPENIIVKSGSTVNLPTPVRNEYNFLGWGTTSASTSGIKTTTVTSDKTYYAIWSEAEPQTKKGDVNNDGVIDAGDAVLISRYDAGLVTLTSAQLKVADVNADGVVDAGDAVVVSRYDAGFISKIN